MNIKPQRQLTSSDIMNMDLRYRAAFINSLSGFKSVALIGSINRSGKTNVAIFNSLVHIGANPPYIGFISRPDSVDRHTLSNIQETSYYTINHIHENIYQQAHQTSARYPKDISEFEATGLTPEFKEGFKAPFVYESHIQLGIEFKEQIKINSHQTVLVVGEIREVHFPSHCLSEDGYLDIEKAQSITCSGLDSYHKTERLARLSYAKPHEPITSIQSSYLE